MKRIITFIAPVILITSCGVAPLYNWGINVFSDDSLYETVVYKNFDKQTPKNICRLIETYDNLINHPGGTRRVPPPGICAEYGYLLIKPETAGIFTENASSSQKDIFDGEDYTAIFKEKGIEMLEKEIVLYPESAQFLKPLITKFKNQ